MCVCICFSMCLCIVYILFRMGLNFSMLFLSFEIMWFKIQLFMNRLHLGVLAIEKRAVGSPSTKVANFTATYIYICKVHITFAIYTPLMMAQDQTESTREPINLGVLSTNFHQIP